MPISRMFCQAAFTVFLIVLLAPLARAAQSPVPAAQSGGAPAPQGDYNPDDPDRREAIRLYQEHKLPEAAVLFEKVVARYPRDSGAWEALGVSLLSRSATQSDPERARADRLRARAALLKAKELGDTSDLSRVLLAGIPEDGSSNSFSQNKEVEAAMERGEAAFAKGEWKEAIQGYTRALELDPRLYLAAVNIGDTYFRTKEWDKAADWFARAIQIDPDREVAYRYWADVLMAQGKMKEAREKFIQGVVAYPYASTSWGGLNSWLTRNHLAYRKISIQLPDAPKKGAKGETIININPGIEKKDGSEAWMMYSMERALWQGDEFAKNFPREKAYRHTLKEETAALSMVATVFKESQQKKKIKDPDPGLVLLAQLQSEGMLEPYVLLVKPDDGIVRDFAAYQAAHRDKLVQFLDKYIVPPAP
jgi:tetratricopeptide (TPR) repeat protein